MLTMSGTSFAQLLPWNSKVALTWDDFQGRPTNDIYYAETDYRISYKMSSDGSGVIKTEVNCYFLKEDSWKRADKPLSDHLLKHEQVHFDIAELYTRKIRKAFSEYTDKNKGSSESSSIIKDLYHQLMDECERFSDQYDAETDHSKNMAKQQEWNIKIATMLTSLDKYEATR